LFSLIGTEQSFRKPGKALVAGLAFEKTEKRGKAVAEELSD